MASWSTLDALKAGYLCYQNCPMSLSSKTGEKVVFVFEDTEDLRQHLSEFNDGQVTVELGRYVQAVKDVKSRMHTFLMERGKRGENRRS